MGGDGQGCIEDNGTECWKSSESASHVVAFRAKCLGGTLGFSQTLLSGVFDREGNSGDN